MPRGHRSSRPETPSGSGGGTTVAVHDEAGGPDTVNIRPDGRRLGQVMVDAQFVTEQQLEAVLADAQTEGKKVGSLLIERGMLSELNLAKALADQHGIPMIDLRQVTPEPAAVELMSEALARRLAVLPISIEGDTVRVAVADPTPSKMRELRAAIGRPVLAVVAPPHDVALAIAGSYHSLTDVESTVVEFEAKDAQRREAARVDEISVNDGAPVVQVVQKIISQALRDRASDIHIEPRRDRIRVRLRVDGALHDVLELPGSMGPAVISRLKIMAGMNIVERRRAQDGQISIAVDGTEVDIRVATTAVTGGEKVVMRILDKSRPLMKLSELGMSSATSEAYLDLLRSPYGMAICAGPTGSGKTTTLYASLGELNTPDRNIMTIEDPVEYTFDDINQIQINEQAGVTFASGLRSILRQDPDVILVGEVRDADTARIAVQSALTGHFVLSSLHATDTASAVHRLLDMGIESFLVASAVTAVVAQRLLRRSCTYCKEPYTPTAPELAFYETVGVPMPADGFTRGAGCNFCNQTGYLERVGVYEFMIVSDRIREAMVERPSHEALRQMCVDEGMRTLRQEAVGLVQSGVTTVAEVIRTVHTRQR